MRELEVHLCIFLLQIKTEKLQIKNLKKWHFSSFPEILSLLTPFCGHIVLRIYCYVIYKIYYLAFRYISRGAVCFYVFMIGLLTQKGICPWEHKNCHTESDPKPIQSSSASTQKHLLWRTLIVLLDTDLKGVIRPNSNILDSLLSPNLFKHCKNVFTLLAKLCSSEYNRWGQLTIQMKNLHCVPTNL